MKNIYLLIRDKLQKFFVSIITVVNQWFSSTLKRLRKSGVQFTISLVVAILSLVVSLVVAFYLDQRLDFRQRIEFVDFKGNQAHVYAKGGLAWSKSFTGQVLQAELHENLYNQGDQFILVSVGQKIIPVNGPLEDRVWSEQSGKILCYDKHGNFQWDYRLEEVPPFPNAIQEFGEMEIPQFLVDTLANGRKEILLRMKHVDGRWPSALQILDPRDSGKHATNTYWHPGVIDRMRLVRDNDDSTFLIISGANNSFETVGPEKLQFGYHYIVAKLPLDFNGSGPYSIYETNFTEEWYYLIAPKNTNIKKLIIDNSKDIPIEVWTGSNWIFGFTFQRCKGIVDYTSHPDTNQIPTIYDIHGAFSDFASDSSVNISIYAYGDSTELYQSP